MKSNQLLDCAAKLTKNKNLTAKQINKIKVLANQAAMDTANAYVPVMDGIVRLNQDIKRHNYQNLEQDITYMQIGLSMSIS